MLSDAIPSSSPAPFLTQPPPLFPCSQVFLCRFHLKLLFLTWLTVWAKTIFISTILAGKTTVLLLEGTQNVPDVIFLYNFIVLNIVIVQSISPSLIFSDNIEENWSAQCSSTITQPSQQRGTPTHRECKMPAKPRWALRKPCPVCRQECNSWLMISWHWFCKAWGP